MAKTEVKKAKSGKSGAKKGTKSSARPDKVTNP